MRSGLFTATFATMLEECLGIIVHLACRPPTFPPKLNKGHYGQFCFISPEDISPENKIFVLSCSWKPYSGLLLVAFELSSSLLSALSNFHKRAHFTVDVDDYVPVTSSISQGPFCAKEHSSGCVSFP